MACDISRLPPLSIKYVQSYNVLGYQVCCQVFLCKPQVQEKGPRARGSSLIVHSLCTHRRDGPWDGPRDGLRDGPWDGPRDGPRDGLRDFNTTLSLTQYGLSTKIMQRGNWTVFEFIHTSCKSLYLNHPCMRVWKWEYSGCWKPDTVTGSLLFTLVRFPHVAPW